MGLTLVFWIAFLRIRFACALGFVAISTWWLALGVVGFARTLGLVAISTWWSAVRVERLARALGFIIISTGWSALGVERLARAWGLFTITIGRSWFAFWVVGSGFRLCPACFLLLFVVFGFFIYPAFGLAVHKETPIVIAHDARFAT